MLVFEIEVIAKWHGLTLVCCEGNDFPGDGIVLCDLNQVILKVHGRNSRESVKVIGVAKTMQMNLNVACLSCIVKTISEEQLPVALGKLKVIKWKRRESFFVCGSPKLVGQKASRLR